MQVVHGVLTVLALPMYVMGVVVNELANLVPVRRAP